MRRDLFMFIISCSAVSLQALLPCARQAEVVGGNKCRLILVI